MSRRSDWSAVGLSSDPVPGDPVVVRQGGMDYRSTAAAMRRAASTLRGLQAGVEKSETVAGLLANRDKIETQVTVAQARYQATGDALVDYAVVLDQTQGATDRALTEAKIAVSDQSQASRLAGIYQTLANSETAPEQASTRSYHLRLVRSYQSDASAARTKLANQKAIIAQAQADRDTAALQAIDKITTATSSDGLKDSWWDDWGAKLVKFIAQLAEAIAAIAGILALLLCWVPGLGQALLAIAAIAGIVAALANIALAATGEISWGEAIVSIIFAALGCIGLGGARGILSALKGGAKLAKGGLPALAAAFKAGGKSVAGSPFINRLAGLFGRRKIPVVSFSTSRAPGLAANFNHAVSHGAPTVLTRTSKARALANRRAVLSGRGKAGPNMSWDEYPFASTIQGGGIGRSGQPVYVRAVPQTEQAYQGGVLSSAYQRLGINQGDKFRVVFTP